MVIYWVQIKDGFAEGKDLVVSVMSAKVLFRVTDSWLIHVSEL